MIFFPITLGDPKDEIPSSPLRLNAFSKIFKLLTVSLVRMASASDSFGKELDALVESDFSCGDVAQPVRASARIAKYGFMFFG